MKCSVSSSDFWAKSQLQRNIKMANLLPPYPLHALRSRKRKSWHLAELTTTDESRDPDLHPGMTGLVGVTDLDHLYAEIDHPVITLAGIADLTRFYPELVPLIITLVGIMDPGYLDPKLDYLVIILVGTADLNRLYPEFDHPE